MSTKLLFKDQMEQLARTPVVAPAYSGSPVTVRLEVPRGHRVPLRIEIVRVLSRSGLRPLLGKRAMEQLLHDCEITVTLPGVEDIPIMIAELAKADVTTTVVEPAFAK